MSHDDNKKSDQATRSDLTLVVKRARIRVSSGLMTGKCPAVSDPSNGIGCQGGGRIYTNVAYATCAGC